MFFRGILVFPVLSAFSLQILFRISVWSTGGSDPETRDWSGTVSDMSVSVWSLVRFSAQIPGRAVLSLPYLSRMNIRPFWRARVKTALHELHIGITSKLPQRMGMSFLFTFLIIMYASTFHTNLEEYFQFFYLSMDWISTLFYLSILI